MWGFGYYMMGLSALFKDIASELGLSRAVTSVAASIGRFEGGFEAPVTGWLIDRFGPRWIVIFGVFLNGLGLILMNFINSLWGFYVVWGVIVATGCNILSLPLTKAITNWFVKKRGIAISVLGGLRALSGVVVLPLIIWLMATQGWRMTCVIGGVVMWLVGLPLAWFFVRQQRPEYYGLLPDGAKTETELAADTSRMIGRGVEYAAEVQEAEFTLRQAMRTPAYWLLLIGYGGDTIAFGAIVFHSVPLLTDMAISPMRAAVIVAIATAVSIPTRLVGGFLADRVKREYLRFILTGTLLLEAAGIAVFLLNQTEAMAYVFLCVFWIGHGIGVTLNPAIRARYFGRKGFGSIQGTSMMFLTPLGALAPIYAGWVYDITGSYIPAFTSFAVLFAFTAVVMSFARAPKPPAEVTDIRKFV